MLLCYFVSQHTQELLGAYFKIQMGNVMQARKRITQQASRSQTVILGAGFLSQSHTYDKLLVLSPSWNVKECKLVYII